MGKVLLAFTVVLVGLAFAALAAIIAAREPHTFPGIWYEDDDGILPPPP